MKIKRNRLKTIICAAVSVLALAYMVGSFALTSLAGRYDVCRGMRIEVEDDAGLNFVTAREIANELGTLPERASGMLLDDINTELITDRLRKIDKIEDVSVVKTSDSRILIHVIPLIPVARVFSDRGSYYINKDNKRISASARYHIDVPLISGNFSLSDSAFTPASLIPLIDWLGKNSKWGKFVTMIKVDSPRDVIIIPAISGHVVNIGEPVDFESKFERLGRMYTDVLPVKGWNFYDTLSVKWAGQVVATRRIKPVAPAATAVDEEDEVTDVSTMLAAEGVAPGQATPGKKAHNEKPIPAAAREASRPDTIKKKPQSPTT